MIALTTLAACSSNGPSSSTAQKNAAHQSAPAPAPSVAVDSTPPRTQDGAQPAHAAAPPTESPSPQPAPSEPLAAHPEPAPTPPSPAPFPAAETPKAEQTTTAPTASDSKEAFPGVWVDVKKSEVRFDGLVPIDAHDKAAPWVFLEVSACSPDTKEHETLVVTKAKPSHVHAALLLIGLKPGVPGSWEYKDSKLKPIDATGDKLSVTFSYKKPDGTEVSLSPEQMIVDVKTKDHFGKADAGGRGAWVFAGSRFVQRQGKEWYEADGAGTLIGLTTFGSETIAWTKTISPEAGVQEPEWIADADTVPPVGTNVSVTIRPAAK